MVVLDLVVLNEFAQFLNKKQKLAVRMVIEYAQFHHVYVAFFIGIWFVYILNSRKFFNLQAGVG